MLDKQAKAEIRSWTKQTKMAREIYFMEQQVVAYEKIRMINARPCIIEVCEETTKSRSGICKDHEYLLKHRSIRYREA